MAIVFTVVISGMWLWTFYFITKLDEVNKTILLLCIAKLDEVNKTILLLHNETG